MIQSVHNYPISDLFGIESKVIYAVPKYQREYTWGRDEWEALFDDVVDNHAGYFLGSIICINHSQDALAASSLEVVDGQQRLVTLSLLFAALYRWLKDHESQLDDDQRLDVANLKRNLVHRGNARQLRVVPQIQNSNLRDFEYVLGESGVMEATDAPPRAGLRRIMRAYRYFHTRLNLLAGAENPQVGPVIDFRSKVNEASLVKIEVANHADAYVLFESLNNRGVPLTAVDLIKNKLLARLERDDPSKTDHYFRKWNRLINFLGDDYSVQERFFRQYYNAFRDDLRVEKYPVAKRSNLMNIYEALIDRDAVHFLEALGGAAHAYAALIFRNGEEGSSTLEGHFRSLERIQGAPGYILLLHLLVRRKTLQLTDAHIGVISADLVRFFVRRNLTNTPPTYDLDRIFMAMIDSLADLRAAAVGVEIRRQLATASASDETFRASLNGPIYDDNFGATRFILCSLAEKAMTKETWVDLWRRENKIYAWTIEHIFPQGDTIPAAWVQMMAGGDTKLAKEIQQEQVHRLGNLTISAYNSSLGNKSFADKRDRTDREGRSVGYRNGLSLNQELARADGWSVAQIEQRTAALVALALDLFRFDGDPQ